MSGGSKSTQTQESQQTQQVNPWAQNQYSQIAGDVRNLTGGAFQPYTGDRVAGLSDAEREAMQGFMANMGQGQGMIGDAAQMAMTAGGYQPMQVGGGYQSQGFTPQQVQGGYQPHQVSGDYQGGQVTADQIGGGYTPEQIQAGSFAGADLSGYMNPYTESVIDASMADINRQRGTALQGVGDAADASSAFGGSRHGVAEAETGRNFDQIAAQTSAGLRQDAFNTAAGLHGQDQNRAMQAAMANQQAGLAGAGLDQQAQMANQAAGLQAAGMNMADQQFGAGFGLQAQGMNQSAGLQGQALDQQAQGMNQSAGLAGAQLGQADRQFGAGLDMQGQLANQQAGLQGAQLGLGAAGALGGLGQAMSGMNANEAAMLAGLGGMERGVEQAGMDAQHQDAMRGYEDQWRQVQAQLGLLGGTPMPMNTSGTGTQTQAFNPGMFDWARVGADAAGQIWSDRGLKQDIEPHGERFGLPWYRFRYVWDGPGIVREGVMAQDVIKTRPEAVIRHQSGYLMVDYDVLEIH